MASSNPDVTMTKYAFELVAGKIEKATKDSAAFDLFYAGSVPLLIGDCPVKVPTGVRTKFTPTLVAFIKEKSGLALKGLEVKGGVIDADYRDEWCVIARNPVMIQSYVLDSMGLPMLDMHGDCLVSYAPTPGWKPYKVSPGDKIAQFTILLLPEVHFYAMPSASLIFKDAERLGGFGSTDVPKGT